jgi:hypothetical protein
VAARRTARFAALLAVLAPGAAGAYDGGRSYAGYQYGPGPGYPLSLPQTLRGTVGVPLHEKPAAPAGTLAALYPALAACWSVPPALDGARGVEITARLSLRRDGSLIGPPRITYAAGIAPAERPVLVRATLDALRHCTPARVTPGLGRAIAGRPVALRLVYRPPA